MELGHDPFAAESGGTWQPTMDSDDAPTWRAVLNGRHAAAGLLTLLACVPAIVGRPSLLVLAVTTLLPYQAALEVMARRGRRPSGPTLVLADHVLAVYALLIDERMVFIAPLVALVSAAGAATLESRRTHVAVAFAAPVLALAGFSVAPSDAAAVFPVSLVGIAVVPVVVGRGAARQRAVRNRYRALLSGVDALVWEGSPGRRGGHLVTGDRDRVLGHAPHDWAQPGFWLDHVHPDDRTRVLAELHDHQRWRTVFALEYRMISANGDVVHVLDRVRAEREPGGAARRLRGVMLDVTHQHEIERSNRRYGTILEHLPIGIVMLRIGPPPPATTAGTDTPLIVIDANPEALDLLGWRRDMVVGKDAALVLGDDPELLTALGSVATTGTAVRREWTTDRHRDGEAVLSLQAFPVAGDGVGLILEDVTDQAVAAAALRHQALHDDLTGLANRALFVDRLHHALNDARRHRRGLAVLVVDLNQFKEINDTLGHHHGDRVLGALAGRLKQRLRECDTIARLGGDEFAVLVTDATLGGACEVGDKVVGCFDDPFDIDGVVLHSSASVGVALFPDHAADAETLMRRADHAMYVAKRSGGGLVAYSADQDRASTKRVTLVTELRRAIDDDQLRIHYQPLLALGADRIDRVEALVRWAHPEHGLIPPSEFIELAEVSGLIRPLTRWVIDTSLAQTAQWVAAGHAITVSANLSVRNLYEPSFVEDVAAILHRHELPPRSLCLELTESELTDEPALALDVLGRLRERGVMTSVDDFGTGFTSVSYLQTLPADEIKIDRSFVARMGDGDLDAATVVRSIADLARNLGLEVVAEGVQDAATLETVRALGVTRAQGFFIGRPATADDLGPLLGRAWPAGRPQR